MPKVVLLAAIGLVGLAVLAALWRKLTRGSVYYLRPMLFTPAERSFLGVLERELPPGVRVFGKVRLADIFGVKTGRRHSEWQRARNRIDRKHVDFLLVRAGDFAPLAGIELDDRSHEAEDRRQRDALVDAVFSGAGLPLLHVAVQKRYHPAELRAQIAALVAERKNVASDRG
jgi:hypothetical protein